MARNGSGTYQAPTSSFNPAVNGVSATAVDWNSLLNDLSSALTQSISADGQTPITGNLAMGGNRLTGLAAGVATGQSLRWEQLFSQGVEVDVSSAATTNIGLENSNFLRITGTTTITSFGTSYNGPRFIRFADALTLTHNASTLILPTGANITTAAGDRAIVVPKATAGTSDGWQVVAYQRASGGALVVDVSSVTGTLAIANGGTGATTASDAFTALKQSATTSATGVVELATDAEAQAGTDTSRAITPANLKAAQIQLGAVVASTSGTAIDFTSIPSWAKRITVIFNGVSTNGTSVVLVQVGDSGGIENTGYNSGATQAAGVVNSATYTAGFGISQSSTASTTLFGKAELVLLDSASNTWAWSHLLNSGATTNYFGAGTKALSATLDRIRITTVGGTDTFDAGTVNISWE